MELLAWATTLVKPDHIFFGQIQCGPPSLDFDFRRKKMLPPPVDYFDWDIDYLFVNQNLGHDNADDVNLTPFMAHKARLLQFQGWAGYALTPYGTIDYYEKVVGKMGQEESR
jgi:hypothetical protein